MRIDDIRKFVKSRATGGLSEQDARDLVKLVGKKHELTTSDTAQLKKIAKEFKDVFTGNGASTFTALTGIKISAHKPDAGGGSSAVDVRSKAIPKGWQKFATEHGALAALKKAVDNGDSMEVRLADGQPLGIDSKDYSDLVKSGDVTVYRNPKDEQSDPDDDTGRQFWMPAMV